MDETERPGGVWWRVDEPLVRVRTSSVRQVGIAAHLDAGAPPDVAEFLVDLHLDKAVVGDHARGRLGAWSTLRAQVAAGSLCFTPEVRILRESAASAVIDDHPGGRLLLCRAAMDLAVAKARTAGVGAVGLRTTPAFLGAYVQRAVDAGMVGIVMTQTYPMVAPFGGRTPLLGNAPIAVGLPAGRHDPVILDMSLTEASASGVKLAAAQDGDVAPGLILDEHGEPTVRARDFPAEGFLTAGAGRSRGSLVPLGGGHKGYALVFVVGLLAAVLSDTDFPWEADDIVEGSPRDPDRRYGSLFLAFDPGAFAPAADVRATVDAYIDTVTGAPRRAGASDIRYPGETSQRLRRERIATDSFLLPESQCQALEQLAQQQGQVGSVRV